MSTMHGLTIVDLAADEEIADDSDEDVVVQLVDGDGNEDQRKLREMVLTTVRPGGRSLRSLPARVCICVCVVVVVLRTFGSPG